MNEMATIQIEVPKHGLDILRQISEGLGKGDIPTETLMSRMVHQQILELIEIALDCGIEIKDVPYVEMFINDLTNLVVKFGINSDDFILKTLENLTQAIQDKNRKMTN